MSRHVKHGGSNAPLERSGPSLLYVASPLSRPSRAALRIRTAQPRVRGHPSGGPPTSGCQNVVLLRVPQVPSVTFLRDKHLLTHQAVAGGGVRILHEHDPRAVCDVGSTPCNDKLPPNARLSGLLQPNDLERVKHRFGGNELRFELPDSCNRLRQLSSNLVMVPASGRRKPIRPGTRIPRLNAWCIRDNEGKIALRNEALASAEESGCTYGRHGGRYPPPHRVSSPSTHHNMYVALQI